MIILLSIKVLGSTVILDKCPNGTTVKENGKSWCGCKISTCGGGCGCNDAFSACGYCVASTKPNNYYERNRQDGTQGNCKEGMVGYGCGGGGCWCGPYAQSNNSFVSTIVPTKSGKQLKLTNHHKSNYAI